MRSRIPARALALIVSISSLVGSVSCRKSGETVEPPAVEPALTRTRLAAPRPAASSSAFDLVPLASGAWLVWGRPSRLGGGIQAVELDAWGGPRGADTSVFAPAVPAATGTAEDALEVDASAARGSIAVVWVARSQLDVSVKSAFGDLGAMRFGQPVVLGPTHRLGTAARGWVSVAARDDGRFQAVVRLADAACEGRSTEPCATVGTAAIRATEVEAVGIPLTVPSPCPELVAGSAWIGPRFHYGVCSASTGAPLTTAYTIETDVSVARTNEILPGCQADGFFTNDDEVLVPGRCPGGRAGVRMGAQAHGMRALPMDAVTVRCEGRTPIVETSASLGATVRLVRPTDHLEVVLPETIAPHGSRAVFTGSTVLVATPVAGEVTLHRYGCDQGAFIATDYM